ncbi:aromatic prenyltransferase [Streptomyces sp. NPDC057280]|uniref:aromatic prenyltransferase n=1 Tax=Streptomyces sp. NPDC057280 TaxID=3346081 RepID=UPI00363F8265
MSEKAEAVYSAIEEASGLLDIAFPRDKVRSVLDAFGEGVSEESLVVLAMAGGERHRGDIDYNFTVPIEAGDPYETAVREGWIEKTDHPVARIIPEILDNCAVTFYGIECGVVGGFKKTYIFFPLDDLGDLSVLASLPSMPKSLAQHARTFTELGLEKRVSIVGIDYTKKTVNIYFMAGGLTEETVLSVLHDTDLPEPSTPELLEFVQNSFSIYPTFRYDSPQIDRICFSVVSPNPESYPTTLFPEISDFAKKAPYEYDGARVLVYGETISREEEYHKLAVYFRRPASFWNNLPLAATFEKLVAAWRAEQ